MSALVRLASSALLIACLSACASAPRTDIPRVDHIRIDVSNMAASVAFYRDMLGLRVRSFSPEFSWLEAGNMSLALSASPWTWLEPWRKDERPGWGMYPHFEVASVEDVASRCKAAGYKVVQEPIQHDTFTEAFVADPDGYVWALFHRR